MQIRSSWTFPCAPEAIWPHFLGATMDTGRPLLFRLGIPKPVSCRVIEGRAAVGRTRQCTTDRGTIDQRILVHEENRRLRYRMIDSTVWCRNWVGHLEDEFVLTPLGPGRTRVERVTTFRAAGANRALRALRQAGLWAALRQAHRYAARNWLRLALAAERRLPDVRPDQGGIAAGSVTGNAT